MMGAHPLVLAMLLGCLSQERRPTPLPESSFGRTPTWAPEEGLSVELLPEGRVRIGVREFDLQGPQPADRSVLLENYPAGALSRNLAKLYKLPDEYSTRPVVLQAGAGRDLRDLLEAARWLASGGPPFFVNLFLQTPRGVVSLPVLIPFPDKERQRRDGLTYKRYFFWDGRVMAYDWDPDPPLAEVSSQAVTTVRVAPLGNGELLVNVQWGPFALVSESLVMLGSPPPPPSVPLLSASRSKARSEGRTNEEGEWLSRPENVKDRDRRRLTEAQLQDESAYASESWALIPEGRIADVLALLSKPGRVYRYTNPMFELTLHRAGPSMTVQEYVRYLDLARTAGFKGVFVSLPR